MALNISKFLARFVEEALEHCNRLESGLLSLESGEDLMATIDAVFRSAHTIKGTARMLKLSSIAETALRMEDVLDNLRSGQMAISTELSDLLLKGVDVIRALLAEVAGEKPLTDVLSPVCEKLEMVVRANKNPEVINAENEDAFLITQASTDENCLPEAEQNTVGKSVKSETATATDSARIRVDKLDDLIKLMGEIIGQQYRKKQHIAELGDLVRLSEQNMELLTGITDGNEGLHNELTANVTALYTRLTMLQRSLKDDAAMESHLTGELQERSLKMRMIPLSTIFDAFHRTVHDLARENGKEVDFRVDGGDTELDRKIIEQIGDSLLHMIRNAIDHGIEPPDVRERAGKSRRGTIHLMAFYDSRGVAISLQDDGAGISQQKIKEVALKRNLVPQATLNKMTERELLELILVPGFSTSSIITDLSGRGVGMDVVQSGIVDNLKGSIQITTHEGEGTTFLLKVPITLALSRVLLVCVANHTFALPANFIQEVLSVQTAQIIDVINKRAVRLREQIIPVEELQTMLKCPGAESRDCGYLLIVVVYSGAERLGLIVDAVLDEVDMVIKPLPASLSNLRLISGVTIGGNNEVFGVLNVASLIKTAREVRMEVPLEMAMTQEKPRKTILVVDDSVNTRDLEKSILEAYGYRVDLADDGMAALGMVNQRMYDAIVTDVEMPQLDGFSLTMRLRQDERYREVPIIIVTSRARDEDKRRGIQLGANAYIVKSSFDQSNLIDTVQNLIG